MPFHKVIETPDIGGEAAIKAEESVAVFTFLSSQVNVA